MALDGRRNFHGLVTCGRGGMAYRCDVDDPRGAEVAACQDDHDGTIFTAFTQARFEFTLPKVSVTENETGTRILGERHAPGFGFVASPASSRSEIS
ncbi:hypothetical protein CHKEEEPN_2930 [Methylorubrum podarium]|nr:hypothetical protein CHKEEEPN_2930 [Methylorubrum podarium]